MKKNEKLLDTLGEVKDEHIPELPVKKKNNIIKWVSGAAGLCAAAVICVFAVRSFGKAPDIEPVPPDVTATTAVTAAPDTTDPDVTAPVTGDEDREITYDRTRKSSVISEITANSVVGGNVLSDTAFTVKTTVDMPAEELLGRINITPKADIALEKTDEFLYTLRTNVSFDKGSVVKLSVDSEEGGTAGSWAFQIVDDFRVKTAYPADGSDFVDTLSGIEITFSEPADMSEIEKHFSVTPELKGKFKAQGNTVYFIPENHMEANVRYRVTVSEGLHSVSGNTIPEDYSFSFTTEAKFGDFYFYGGICETFISGDPIVAELYGRYEQITGNVELHLYKYASSDDYMRDLGAYAESGILEFDKSSANEVFSSDEEPLHGKSYGYTSNFVLMPDDLEEGHYIAEITVSGITKYHFLEINPVSVYSMSVGDTSLFYINDAETGKPAAGAKLTLYTENGGITATADKDGLAKIKLGKCVHSKDILEITYNGHRYIDSVTNYSIYEQSCSDLFYSYIYTDREAYQSTDTINVWGVIRPRRKGAKVPENLIINLGIDYNLCFSQKVTPSADGTFTAKLSYSDWAGNQWSISRLSLMDADNDNAVISSKYLRVFDYVKPTYSFDIELPEYLIMPQRDPFNIRISAEYFDGTPAKDVKLSPSNVTVISGSTSTDENGIAELSAKLEDIEYDAVVYYPYVSFNLSGIENSSQWVAGQVPAIYRDVMLDTSYDEETNTYTLTANKVNFDKLPEYVKTNGSIEMLRGEPSNTKVEVEITRHWTETYEAGSYYDFVEKKVVTRYEYKYNTELVKTCNVTTENGKAVIADMPADENSYYTLQVYYCDTLGQRTMKYDSYGKGNWWYDTGFRVFDLISDKSRFEEDEPVKFTLKEEYDTGNGKPEGKVLFIPYQYDILDAVVYDSTEFSYAPDDRCTPDFNYCGAYFDGRHVFPINSGDISFDPSKRAITLEMSADKEKYDAGGEVTLTVYAKDKDGNPVSGAPVALSVVDEAAFSVRPQNADVLGSLYSFVRYPIANQSCSYVQHVMNGLPGSEKGGGGDDEGMRKDFSDNPYFGEQKTDASGKTVFKFKLADTITSWRATAQTISVINDRLCAGSAKYQIRATRPVFITPIMLSEYTVGDDIAFTAKCAGLESGGKISVTLSGSEEKTIEILPTQTANFGKLPKGEYTVTFRAKSGENSDAMQLPLTVVETKQEVRTAKDLDLGRLSSISPTKWPVSVSFFDKEYLFCKEILQDLAYYYGGRIDAKLAADFAISELWQNETDIAERVRNATASGFAALNSSSTPSARLTALICAAFPEYVYADAVEEDFLETMKNTDLSELAYCYMGLAAIGRPVLNDIKYVLSAYGDQLTLGTKLCLAAGLALGGDFDAAYEVYISSTKEMKFYSGKDNKPYAYLENETYTGLALITASVLDLPEAEVIARGLRSKEAVYESYALELVTYVRNYVPKTSGNASFSYDMNGVKNTVTLDRYGRRTIVFTEEQFKNTNFSTVSGEVLACACYTGRITEIDKAPNVTVTKSYSKSSGLRPGDIVTVTVKTSKPWCVVEDIIPSCARVFGMEENGWQSLGSQRVRLYTDKNGDLTYKIKINTSGEFIVEGAYAYRADSDGFCWGISKSEKMTVTAENETA